MDEHLTIAGLRTELELTLAEMAERVGLTSKSQMHEIERTNRASVDVALRLEELSAIDGLPRIDAADLCEDVRKARHGLDTATAPALCANGQSGEMSGQSSEQAA